MQLAVMQLVFAIVSQLYLYALRRQSIIADCATDANAAMEGRSGPLTFRVMRLTTPLPSARPGLGAACAETAATGVSSDALLRAAAPWEGEGAACGAGATTVLPTTFGSIYASETFRCLVAMHNGGRAPVTKVTVLVELDNDAASLHRVLHDTRTMPRDSLPVRGVETHVVNAHLPEPGMHVLKCTATFMDASRQLRTFRQFYRFNVLAPFEPSVAVMPVGEHAHLGDADVLRFMVELRLLNATPAPIYIESATLRALPEYSAQSLVAPRPGGEDSQELDMALEAELPHARRASVSAGDTHSFMYHLSRPADTGADAVFSRPPSVDSSASTSSAGGSTRRRREMGAIDVAWRSSLGERGVMRAAATVYEPRRRQADVALAVTAVPRAVRVQQPFAARCSVANNADTPLRLYLQVRRDLVGEIVPVGVSGVALPEIAPGQRTTCTITLMPLRAGQHPISGVRVVDLASKKSYAAEPPVVTVL